MNFGLFFGIGFIGSVISFLIGIIVLMFVLWLIFATPLGLFLIAGLIILGLIKLFKLGS